jgi:SAM-dependent methyltransferase
MNYGFEDGSHIPLETYEETNRYALQMYHHVAGQVDLRGLNVLEIGSGRGGGAAYVMRIMRPRTYIGVDISQRNIAFCRKQYRAPGLHYKLGDAENLDFRADRFDAVINIESSSHYGNLGRFFDQVHRVLRPGGYFLYADTWQAHEVDTLYARLKQAGLVLLSAENMGPQVFKALDQDQARVESLVAGHAPGFLHTALAEFVGMRGSEKYEDFRSGKVIYLCCLLAKEPIQATEHTQAAQSDTKVTMFV